MVISHNTLISACLLFNKKPFLSIERINLTCRELYQKMMELGVRTYISNPPSNKDIVLIVQTLEFKVIGDADSKGAKVSTRQNNFQEQLFSLHLYTNPLLCAF